MRILTYSVTSKNYSQKWCCNQANFLKGIPKEYRALSFGMGMRFFCIGRLQISNLGVIKLYLDFWNQTVHPKWIRPYGLCIKLNPNRGVILFWPIRRQDTKIGGCHLAFFPHYFCTGARTEQRV